ncbi:hypothetical protein A5712_27845 [Mycobacterium sp. E2327]|uniref:enoyl-CoA hydratase/isomerase family protein n=1 Tax=Mycobacterium sp. E2327 TaxID=1834132 RepID=UPI0007FFD65E|nr:enoyl-CoA hydratase-related protein [Mycobacterium sp. E2327]OBI15736.1 hypothetical protein A5712_27845 [Mycobacterium sp. E2327]
MTTLLAERFDGVVQLTMHRPEVRNALNTDLLRSLSTALTEIAACEADRAVVICGSGRAFCSGGDLSETTSNEQRIARLRLMNDVILQMHDLPKPIIAKVRGPAIGGGLGLALACDLIVAGEDAVFSAVFAKLGLSLDMGCSWQLVRLVGLPRAREIAYFGDSISAGQALEMGLINRVVPADAVDEFVEQWARRLAASAPLALSSDKKLLERAFRSTLAEGLEAETIYQTVNVGSADADEARRAFRENRPPRFAAR